MSIFPLSSVTVHVIVLVPIANVSPLNVAVEFISFIVLATPQLSSLAVGSNSVPETVYSVRPLVKSITWFGIHVIV